MKQIKLDLELRLTNHGSQSGYWLGNKLIICHWFVRMVLRWCPDKIRFWIVPDEKGNHEIIKDGWFNRSRAYREYGSNGRYMIWEYLIKIIKKHKILGRVSVYIQDIT